MFCHHTTQAAWTAMPERYEAGPTADGPPTKRHHSGVVTVQSCIDLQRIKLHLRQT